MPQASWSRRGRKMSKPPYKQIFVGGKWDDIYRLPAQAMQLWLYHYRCENGELRESWPSEPQICEALGIHRDTMYFWRGYLVENGWLEQLALARSADVKGEGIAPSFKARHGIVPPRQDKRKGNRPKLQRRSQAAIASVVSENFRPQVSSRVGKLPTPSSFLFGFWF